MVMYSDSGPQVNPYAPTDMKTLVYSPEARIYVLHNGVQYDVSADLIRGAVQRKENSAATLVFTLANKPLTPGGQPRYNAGQPFAFSRMDVVTLYLKRTRMIQVFTGFLDDIPYRQLHPGVADFKATCTIKKLIHTWWNPATPENQSLMTQYGFNTMVGGDGQYPVDSGLGGMLREILIKVGNWNPDQLHVQNFPMAFFPFVKEYLDRNMPGYRAAQDAFMTMLLGPDHYFPPGSAAGYNASAPLGNWPPPGAGIAGTGQAAYLPYIIAACDARGMGPLTTNLAQAANLQASGDTGASASDFDAAAWQQLAKLGIAQNKQEMESDAAILAVACILVETGGTWKNFANPTVEASLTYPNDGLPPNPNLDSVGLFQQRAGWGIIAQRMNPYSAAGMFYDKLNEFNWRNMLPGAAVFKVQIGASVELYQAAYEQAKGIVQAYRQAQGAGTAAASSVIINSIPAASSLTSTVTSAVNAGTSSISTLASTGTGAAPALANLRAGKPNPDSEGAINAATLALLPISPYKAGGKTPGVGLDSSGLTEWAFRCIGRDIGTGTTAQSALPNVNPTTAAQRGDLILLSTYDTIGIYLGGNLWLEHSGPDGSIGGIRPLPEPLTSVRAVLRVCQNGGIDPSAPFTPPIPGMPRGLPAGTGDRGGTSIPGGVGGGARANVTEPIARNLFSFQFMPGTWAAGISRMLPGEKQFIDGQPLIQMVQALCRASLRNFQSAPNGDFMAYTPDEFGLYGKPSILMLEDIEIKDFRIDLSDEPLTTHVYVDGDYVGLGQDRGLMGWIMSAGVATMENEPLFNQLRKVAPADMQGLTGRDIIRKFGVRPFKQTYTMVGNPAMEFLLATQLFMGKFSSMYRANVALTFMPELYPGMRVMLKKHNLQMYCSAVEHSFDYEQGFSTRAQLSSPTDPVAVQNLLQENPLSNWRWPSDNFMSYNLAPEPTPYPTVTS